MRLLSDTPEDRARSRFWSQIVREAIAMSRARIVPALLISALVIAMTATTLLTVGRASAARDRVADALESAGARETSVTDSEGQGLLTPVVIDSIRSLSNVERAVGLGAPSDVDNAAIGPGSGGVTAWPVVGELTAVAEITSGRAPHSGEAIVTSDAMHALRMVAPSGAIIMEDGSVSIPVVGTYRPLPPFTDINGAIIATPDDSALTLVVIANSATDAVSAQNSALMIISPSDISSISVSSPGTVADLHAEIVGDLDRYGRSLLMSIISSGSILIAVVVLADILVGRMDLGRRRALGASRGDIIALVLLRVSFASLWGVLIGCGGASVALLQMGEMPGFSFMLGLGSMALLTATTAAIPPAIAAAFQDPLRVLRTP